MKPFSLVKTYRILQNPHESEIPIPGSNNDFSPSETNGTVSPSTMSTDEALALAQQTDHRNEEVRNSAFAHWGCAPAGSDGSNRPVWYTLAGAIEVANTQWAGSSNAKTPRQDDPGSSSIEE